MPSGSNSHSANSSNSKRKGSDEGDALQSNGSSGKRNFVRSWTKDFPWLEYDGEKMRCKPCCSRTTESDSSSVFVTGSTNFKIESIRSHEKSNGHNRAVAAIKVAENPRLALLPRVLWTVSQDVAQKMERLFDIAYFVAKREMPFTSFPHLCHLEMKHGVDLGSTYINDKACKNFVLSIAAQLKDELSCKLQKCRFISVMADSATDVGVREVEDVYVCHLAEGETVNTFAGLKECVNSKADGIKVAVDSVMEDICDGWKNRAVAMGSDGAPVMLGDRGGVFALLKQEIPHLIKVHCIAHRLELAFSDTLLAVPEFKDIKDMLQGIWKQYHYSPKAVRELKEVAESMEVRAYKAVKADGTRWVPHLQRALSVLLLKNYKVVLMHLQHAAEVRDSSAQMQGRAQNYSGKLASFKFLSLMHLLLDIVEAISKVSLAFQEDGISISRVQDKLATLSTLLEAFKHRPGHHLHSFLSEVGDDNCFKDQELKRSDGDSDSFNRLKETAIDASLRFIQERFQGMETDPVLLAAATLTTHQSWPVGNRNLLLLHGEHDIQVLVDHFKVPLQRNNFHLQHCLEEWMDMKFHVQRVRDELTLRQDVFWKNKFMLCQDRFPNLLMLIEICLVIPCQTACCERGNSCMSRIMTDWRCTLDVSTVEALMRISINGPSPEDYHAALAVGHWMESGERSRRPTLMD